MSEYHIYIATAGNPLTSWTEIESTDEIEAVKALHESEKFSREEINEIKIQKSRNANFYNTLETWFSDSSKFSLYFKGFLSVSDVAHDSERAWFKFQPKIDDDYRYILAGNDSEYDVWGTLTGLDVTIYDSENNVPNFQAGSPGASMVDFDAWASAGGVISTAIANLGGVNIEGRYTALGTVTQGDVYFVKITNFASVFNDPKVNVLSAADVGISVEGAQTITADGTYCFTIAVSTINAYLVIFNTPAAAQADFSLDFYYDVAVNVNNGMKWLDFLERFVVDKMVLTSFSGKIKSTFLNNDNVPTAGPSTIDSWITSNPNGNYAYLNTGSNPLTSFIVSEVASWIDSETNDFRISFNDIMADIRGVLQAWWYIDESDNLRVEHLSWFEYLFLDSTGIVLTSATYEKYRPFSDSEEKKFNKSELSNREQFTWPQSATGAAGENFRGNDIIYDDLEVLEVTHKTEPSRVNTDVKWIVDNPSTASDEGYLYLIASKVCNYNVVQKEAGLLATAMYENNHFAWGNLHPRYWTWQRSSRNGNMNGAATTFDSAIRFLEQSVSFGYQNTLDVFERIITEDGSGFQLETTRNLDTDFLTIKLGFDPYA